MAIGQKASSVATVVRKLEEHGAMAHTNVVVASAAEAAALQLSRPILVVQWVNTFVISVKML